MIKQTIIGLFKIVKNTNILFERNASIYSNIKPLLIVCKIFVTLPVRNITDELSDVTFKWRSWYSIFTILFYPCVWLLGLSILYINNEPFVFHLLPFAIFDTLSNIFFLWGCKTFIKLLKSIHKFDKLCYEFNTAHEDKRVKIYKYLWGIFAACSHVFVVVTILSLYDLHQCRKIGGVCHLIYTYFERTQRQIQIILFVFLSYELSLRFKKLDIISEQFLKTGFQSKIRNYNFSKDFEKCRILYKQLFHSTRMFNDVFGFRMIVVIALFFFDVISVLMAAMFFPDFYDRLGIIYMIFSFLFLCFAATSADSLQKSSKGIQEIIKKLPVTKLSHSTRWQVSHLLHQCDLNNISISACGIVNIDNKSIFLILSCITTFVIAMIQIVPEINNI